MLVQGVEGHVMNAVAVDFADVEIGLHFRYVGGGDAVGGAVDDRRVRRGDGIDFI